MPPTRRCARPAAATALLALVISTAACDGKASTSDPTEPTSSIPSPTSTADAEPVTRTVFPGADWSTAEPAAVGMDPEGLDELAGYLEGTASNCMAVVKGGRIVDERYWNDTTADTDQEIFSASKSVSSTLVGIAQDQGHLSIVDPASTWIDEWQGTASEDVTVRNLIGNDSGRYWDFQTDYLTMIGSPDRTAFAIGLDQQHPPGEHWEYNNSAIQTLEAVLERSTGTDVGDYAEDNLFGPIGMTSTIIRDRADNPTTFMGVQASCRDLARFGYLFLRDGEWDGGQVVSAEWVDEATSPSQNLNRSYGHLWWINAEAGWLTPLGQPGEGTFWPNLPLDAYAALGLGDQICLVVPSEDLVVVRLGPWRAVDELGMRSTSVDEMGRLALAAIDEG